MTLAEIRTRIRPLLTRYELEILDATWSVRPSVAKLIAWLHLAGMMPDGGAMSPTPLQEAESAFHQLAWETAQALAKDVGEPT